MRKVVFGATFLGASLAVRAALADSAAIHLILGILAILVGLALAGLVIELPALLASLARGRFFNRKDLDFNEPEPRLFILPSALEARPAAIAG